MVIGLVFLASVTQKEVGDKIYLEIIIQMKRTIKDHKRIKMEKFQHDFTEEVNVKCYLY